MKETIKGPIKVSEIDPKFKYKLSKIPGGEKVMRCFQCGTCTSDCPIARFSDTYRPRRIIRMTQLGMKDNVLNSDTLWFCASCFTCTDRCPQNVDVASVIRVLRNLAVEEGYIYPSFQKLAGVLAKNGRTFEDDSFMNESRGDLGLPPITSASCEDIAKILQKTKLSNLDKKGGDK